MSPVACIIIFICTFHGSLPLGTFLKETSKFWPKKFHADYVNLECNIIFYLVNNSESPA